MIIIGWILYFSVLKFRGQQTKLRKIPFVDILKTDWDGPSLAGHLVSYICLGRLLVSLPRIRIYKTIFGIHAYVMFALRFRGDLRVW